MRWLLTALVVAGCYHEQPAPPANRTSPPVRRASADVLAYLPIDADAVFAIDVPQVRATAIWQKYEPMLLDQSGRFERDKVLCGFDPMTSFQRVTLAVRNNGGAIDGVAVVRGLPRDAMMACLGKVEFPNAKITVERDVIYAQGEGSARMVMGFVDAKTLVVQFGAQATAATLDAVMRSGSPLRGSPAFADMFGHLDTGAPAWIMINGSSKAFASLARMGFPMRSAGASIKVGDGFELAGRARFESAAKAQQLAQLLVGQIGPVKTFVDSIDVADDDVDVKFTVTFSESQLERMMALAGLAGSLGGP